MSSIRAFTFNFFKFLLSLLKSTPILEKLQHPVDEAPQTTNDNTIGFLVL